MKSLDSAHEECMNTCLLPRQSIQGRLKHRWLTGILKLPPPHTPQPELSKCSSPACLSSQLHTGVKVTMIKERPWL